MDVFRWLNRRTSLKCWFLVFLSVLAILFFSLTPRPFTAAGIETGDMLNFDMLHIIAYFVLSFLTGTALMNSRHSVLRNNHYSLAILLPLIFSGFTELMQFLVPGRYPGFMDMIYNLLGIILAQTARFILRNSHFRGASFLRKL